MESKMAIQMIKFGTLIFKHKKTGAKLTCKDNVFVGDTIKDVNEYDLSVPWDVSTASFLQVFNVTADTNSPYGLSFKLDGTKMYVIGRENDKKK